jgi:hypothetical protein
MMGRAVSIDRRQNRRAFLAQTAAVTAAMGLRESLARAEVDGALAHPVPPPPQLEFKLLEFEHTPMYGGISHAIVAVPKGLAPGEKLPLAVLLPGGHHNMQGYRTGVWGWWCEYMLGQTDTALRRGTLTDRDFLKLVRPEELTQFNGWLASTPYRGMVFCTPWVVGRQLDPGPHGTMVAEFLRIVVARVRAEFPVVQTREGTGLGGMSSGGLWTIYSGSLCSDLFGTLVATQPFTDELVPPLRAVVKARALPQRLRMVSSRDDHQKKTTIALSQALRTDGIDHDYVEYLGAHSAEFAAGPGGLDALLVFDRALRGEYLDGTKPAPPVEAPASIVAVDERIQLPVDATRGNVSRESNSALIWTAAAAGAAAIGFGAARVRRSPPAKANIVIETSPEEPAAVEPAAEKEGDAS